MFGCAFLICLFVETREKKFSLFGVGCVKISSKSQKAISFYLLNALCTRVGGVCGVWTIFFFNVAECMSYGMYDRTEGVRVNMNLFPMP